MKLKDSMLVLQLARIADNVDVIIEDWPDAGEQMGVLKGTKLESARGGFYT